MSDNNQNTQNKFAFKVCLKDINQETEDEIEIKRFEIPEEDCNLINVLTRIEQIFPILLQHEYYLSWVDQVRIYHTKDATKILRRF